MNHQSLSLLTDIGLGIVFAAAASHVARVLRQPLILGYVLGGILLGSHLGFGLVVNEASIELISEIGLIMLLFIIGLEINIRELARMGKAMFILGVAQFAGSVALGLVFFKLLGYSMGGGNFDLLYVAVALALSSTLIVVKLLHDKFEVHTMPGRITVGVLVLQDIWAILFMAFQPNLLHPEFGTIAKSLGQGLVLIGLAFGVSRYVLSRLLYAAAKSPELVLLTSAAWCFGICGLAEKAGLSKEMGALIAGLSIAAFPYGTDVTAKLAGVRDFFVTLFFVSLGLKVPHPTLASLGLALVAVGVVTLTRLVSVVIPAYFSGLGLRTGIVTALNLSQISEFSLVILALGAGYGHVSAELQSFILTSMLLASVISTYLILFNDPLSRWLLKILAAVGWKEKAIPREEHAVAGEHRDIVLLGCFREGEALLEEIEVNAPEMKKRVLVVDFNPQLRRRLEERGYKLVYGDFSHPQTLHHLGIEDASVVICAVSDVFLKGTTTRRLLTSLKALVPEAKIIMSVDDQEHADKLIAAGAAGAVVASRLAGTRLYSLVADSAEPIK